MAAAKRTRSRVCGPRLSCFAIQSTSSGLRERISVARARPENTVGRRIANRRRLPFPPMPAPARVLRAAALVCGVLVPARLAAQGSPYLPLDDPRLPLLEHLIARGDVADPSPQVRPFRWADAARVLAAADTAGAPARDLVAALHRGFEVPAGDRWRLAARGGAQAFSHVRRDVLHPLGPDGVRPYADFTGEATMGPIVLVSRPAAPTGISPGKRRGPRSPWGAAPPPSRGCLTTPSGRAGPISSSPGEWWRRTAVPSSSTAASSTVRWTATGGRPASRGFRSATTHTTRSRRG